jgi:hypothetical protein
MSVRRWIAIGAAVLVALPLLLVAVVMAASEFGGELITLHTRDLDGVEHTTSLWIIEGEGHAWLRAGDPGSGWLQRLGASPEVLIERGGKSTRFRAVPMPERIDFVNEAMARKYGFANALIDFTLDASDAIAVRLDPI